jgi:antitoxin component YwqK of YwqJK toxin-antitoxin module
MDRIKYLVGCCFVFVLMICNAQKRPDNGPYEQYYETGELKTKGQYINRKRAGVWKDFYKSGVLKELYRYKNGKKDFVSKLFFENGNLKSENIFIDGKKHSREYYETGPLFYDKCRAKGYANDYYENGNLKIERPIVEGELSGVCKHFDETGMKTWEVLYKDSYKGGAYKQFYKNGQLKVEGSHVLGVRVGLEKRYSEDGKLLLEGKYAADKLHGKWNLYDKEGNVIEKLKFSKGKLVSKSSTSFEAVTVPHGLVFQNPIHPKCNKVLGRKKQKKCLSMAITEHVREKFNVKLAKKYGITGRLRINVAFKIDAQGEVVGVRAKAPLKVLKDEAIRVVKLLPKMTPGQLRGKDEDIPYSLPIIFAVQ